MRNTVLAANGTLHLIIYNQDPGTFGTLFPELEDRLESECLKIKLPILLSLVLTRVLVTARL